MSNSIECGESYFFVSNRRCLSLFSEAIKVAQEIAVEEHEHLALRRLGDLRDAPGFPDVISIRLEQLFTELPEQKFLARVLEALAWRVFREDQGNSPQDLWQVSYISDCHLISRMFTSLVWQSEPTFWPNDGDPEGMRPDPFRWNM